MYIVADIGGTKTRIARSDDLEKFGEPIIIGTAQDYAEGLREIGNNILALSKGSNINGIIVGIRGIISHDRQSLLKDRVLPRWNQQAVATDLKNISGASFAYLENDTALVGLGEAIRGAGSGADIVAYLTVSTGVGGVRIVNGHIDDAHQGFEPGGQYITVNPPQTLEELVSGEAVSKNFGKHPRDLGKESPVWEDLAQYFAYGLYNSILHWSPDTVVLGGSMFNEIGISVSRVEEYLQQINKKYPELPKVVHSSLGDVGGLYGGLARLKQLS